MISILHYLYRKSRFEAIAVSLAILLLSGLAAGQIRDRTEHPRADEGQPPSTKKPAKRGPRAIAVIEFLPKGGAQLVPIALWMDGHYYDASFYGANPAPMALEPETLYQALSYGEPTGWFTVTKPKQVNGTWIAEGQWKPQQGSLDTKIAQQAAKQPKKKVSPINDDSGPPVLRRSPSSGSSEQESSGTQSTSPGSSGGTSTTSSASNAPSANDDSDRPTLKNSSPPSADSRPTLGADTSSQGTAQAASAPPPTVSSDDTDPDRPTLKNSSPPSSERPTNGGDASQANAQAPTTPPPPTVSSDENDPDRPVLHRGKPSDKPNTAAPVIATKPSASNSKAATAVATQPLKAPAAKSPPRSGSAFPAISDAGNYDIRSLLYSMTPAEKEERSRPMLALALEELRNYRVKRQPIKGPAKAPAKAAAAARNFVVTDYDLRAFDLDFSNSPTLVLTAKVPETSVKAAPGSEFDYFITVVARVDINGQAQKVFSSVTDNNHLDAFPRMEIIDAVDADANGRGDLLFRQHSDTGVSYALYRVYPYQMVKVFEGGSSM